MHQLGAESLLVGFSLVAFGTLRFECAGSQLKGPGC